MRKNFALEPRGEWFELADERIGPLASTENHAWERSLDTGRLKVSNPVQPVHWRFTTRRLEHDERRCQGSETWDRKNSQLTSTEHTLPYGCG
jgi:hypothetical protein